jgi:hypothetical protein
MVLHSLHVVHHFPFQDVQECLVRSVRLRERSVRFLGLREFRIRALMIRMVEFLVRFCRWCRQLEWGLSLRVYRWILEWVTGGMEKNLERRERPEFGRGWRMSSRGCGSRPGCCRREPGRNRVYQKPE